MPRAATITQDQVNAIANQLNAKGIKPTVRLVIAEHGSGSQGTVHPMLKNWERGNRPATEGVTLSPVLVRMLQEHFTQEVAHATAEVRVQLADSEEAAGDLARENKAQANLLEQREEEIGKLTDGAAAMQGRFDQLERELVAAQEEAARLRGDAEHAHTELAKAQMRLDAMPRLEADLAAARAECDSERQVRIAAERDAAVGAAQRDSLAARVEEDKTRIEALEAQLAAGAERERRQAADLTSTRVAVEAGNARLEQADRTIASLKTDLTQARASERAAVEAAAELRGASPGK
jgi:colicin import membrane protein